MTQHRGRPPRADTAASKTVTTRWTVDELTEIQQTAERSQMTVSDFIREAVRACLRRNNLPKDE